MTLYTKVQHKAAPVAVDTAAAYIHTYNPLWEDKKMEQQ